MGREESWVSCHTATFILSSLCTHSALALTLTLSLSILTCELHDIILRCCSFFFHIENIHLQSDSLGLKCSSYSNYISRQTSIIRDTVGCYEPETVIIIIKQLRLTEPLLCAQTPVSLT